MTTTAYDTTFFASDIAFTDNNDVVHLNVPFRKVKRIGSMVFGMAGCLACMRDYTQMILDYVKGTTDVLAFPQSIINRADRDFIVMVHLAGGCFKFDKLAGAVAPVMQNVTQTPTVIGSGSYFVDGGFKTHQNAVVAVLEAIRSKDKYTDGEVKYCSVQLDDVHNLEIDPMNSTTALQVTGMQNEINAANDFMAQNQGKTFHASTKVAYVGKPEEMPLEAGMAILQQGLDVVREQLKVANS